MAKVKNQATAIKLIYELPTGEEGKTARKSKSFANIKFDLNDNVIFAFGEKVFQLQNHTGKVQRNDAKELIAE